MTTIVTGHRGFLGGYVVERLRAEGVDVVGAGRPELEIPSREWEELVRREQPDAIVHCAGPASVPASVADPEADRAGALDTLAAVLEHAGGARVLLVSSAAVYGDPATLPVSEDAPLRPVSPYGRHRVEAEELARSSGAAVAVARVFSAYGEGLRRQLLWDVAGRALAGGPIELSGTGRESRDFVHAADVASALVAILREGSFDGGAYNVGTGVETTTAEVAELIRAELGGGELRFSGVGRPGDPARWRADPTKLRSLGWEPGVPLAEGVARYARWVREPA